ncbi:MAG TPA: hypothetical protein VFN09_08000 [Rhodanobacteraceae bacterium]|nr:hypothetical protein [Rhodanobacteraceae bacterium]
MRKLYSSPRLENIDMVVELLRQHGIEASIQNVSQWRGRSHARFSYLKDRDADRWPQVWVMKTEDQTTARALLREAGIEPAVRHADLLAVERGQQANPESQRRVTANRIRVALIAIIAVLALLRYLYG